MRPVKPSQRATGLRVLVVDDTIVYRKAISDILSEIPGVAVVGSAQNGRVALQRVVELKPHLVTLDIEMPEMDGLTVLRGISKKAPDVGVVMLSAHTRKGGKTALRALEMGAFDFICKPRGESLQENRAELKKALVPVIRAFERLREVRGILRGREKSGIEGVTTRPKTPHERNKTKKVLSTLQYIPRSRIVAIGVSTGGPVALARFLPEIPGSIGVPFLIAQHMPPLFTESLARNLDRHAAITVKEAVNGEKIEPNTAYIAPGGKQMKVAEDVLKKNKIIRITDDAPENGCAPSADYLFRSVAQHYGGNATGVIMTGMGSDGTRGLQEMKAKGAFIIAQDELTSVVFGMAKKAVETGIVDLLVPLDQLAHQIRRTIAPSIRDN